VLNERRVPTPNGYGEWKAEQVSRLLRRLKRDGALESPWSPAAVRKGGRLPFGYKSVDGRLVKNDDEQAALARMVALRDQGATLRTISLAIAREFRRTMTPTTIKRILDRAAV
jgi:hypothetical protein